METSRGCKIEVKPTEIYEIVTLLLKQTILNSSVSWIVALTIINKF